MNLRESIIQILSDKKAKKEGLHVKHIARHIFNSNRLLFSDEPELDYEKLKDRVNRILLYDVNKKRKNRFARVINPKTNKYRKGRYKIR
jgi:hypothetical protein